MATPIMLQSPPAASPPSSLPLPLRSAHTSRSVAHLSADKLAKKRATDRASQRVLRERNKTRLADLEDEVRRLKDHLSASEAHNALLQKQGESRREAIDCVVNQLHALRDGTTGTDGHETAGLRRLRQMTPPLSLAAVGGSRRSSVQHGCREAKGEGFVDEADERCRALSPVSVASRESIQSTTHSMWHNGGWVTFDFDTSPTGFALDLDELTGAPNTYQLPRYTGSALRNFAHYHALSSSRPPCIPRSPSTFLAAEFASALTQGRLEANGFRTNQPLWALPPSFCGPTCRMDYLVHTLMDQKRREGMAGPGVAEFATPGFPSVGSLLNPMTEEEQEEVGAGERKTASARHVANAINVPTVPEKIALLYMTCLIIRWLICPTEEYYDVIPDAWKPSGAEMVIPHPIWLGILPSVAARERLVRFMDHTQYPLFETLGCSTYSVNWAFRHELPYGGMLAGSQEKGFVMSAEFLRHVRNPANWTFGRCLVDAFPFLEGTLNVKG